MAMENSIIVIRGGTLIDGTGSVPIKNAVIVIDGSRIKALGEEGDIDIPSDAKVIDAYKKTVMPGMIDAHVHLEGVFDPNEPNMFLATLKTPPTLLVLWAAKHAKETLEAGFTTVRNMGGPEGVSLREAIKLGLVLGPRIVTAGWVTATGGHYDYQITGFILGLRVDTADDVSGVRKLTRERIREGVDFIKTCASDSPIADGHYPSWTQYTKEELKTIVDEAHAVGKKVAAHAEGTEGIKNAIEAGIDTIEHGTLLDDEAIQMMLERNTILVPTLGVFSALIEAGLAQLEPQKVKEVMKAHVKGFKKAYKAGVRIAMGTDTWRELKPGENARELKLMVKHGMTEKDALVACTKTGSEALGLENTLGTIEKGKIADILIVEGNPLKDIKVLQDKKNIQMIMKNGVIIKIDQCMHANN